MFYKSLTLSLLLYVIPTSCLTRSDIKKALYPATKITLGCAYVAMGCGALLVKPMVHNSIIQGTNMINDTDKEIQKFDTAKIPSSIPISYDWTNTLYGYKIPFGKQLPFKLKKIAIPKPDLAVARNFFDDKKNTLLSFNTPAQYTLTFLGTTLLVSGMLQIKEGYSALKQRFHNKPITEQSIKDF